MLLSLLMIHPQSFNDDDDTITIIHGHLFKWIQYKMWSDTLALGSGWWWHGCLSHTSTYVMYNRISICTIRSAPTTTLHITSSPTTSAMQSTSQLFCSLAMFRRQFNKGLNYYWYIPSIKSSVVFCFCLVESVCKPCM